jgi:hypothetical protein
MLQLSLWGSVVVTPGTPGGDWTSESKRRTGRPRDCEVSAPGTSIEDAEKVENELRMQADQDLTMPELRVGRSVLWLLAIYRKDSKGFPASYVSSVTRPTQVEFYRDGKRVSASIRKPLLDKAATVAVPFGWYQQ